MRNEDEGAGLVPLLTFYATPLFCFACSVALNFNSQQPSRYADCDSDYALEARESLDFGKRKGLANACLYRITRIENLRRVRERPQFKCSRAMLFLVRSAFDTELKILSVSLNELSALSMQR